MHLYMMQITLRKLFGISKIVEVYGFRCECLTTECTC